MSSTISPPSPQQTGNNPAALSQALFDVATAAVADINAQTGAALSSTTPATLTTAAGAVGTGTTVARADHAHQVLAATTSTGGAQSAADKLFEDNLHSAAVALADASVTIAKAAGYWRVMPAATLSTDRTVTLGTTGAVAGDQFTVTRLDATANQLIVVNGGAGTGTLLTLPVSKVGYGVFQYDGTNWALRQAGTV